MRPTTKDRLQSRREALEHNRPFALLAWLLWWLALQQFISAILGHIDADMAQVSEFDLNHLTLPGVLVGLVAPALIAALAVLVIWIYSMRHHKE